MEMEAIYHELNHFSSVVRLHTAASPEELRTWETTTGLSIPPELRDLLTLFNGGEIFIPGTIICGTRQDDDGSLSMSNAPSFRSHFRIPDHYLVFAILNFGDLICVNLESPHDVIQWDHEEDEQFDQWDTISNWLETEIQAYREDMEGSV